MQSNLKSFSFCFENQWLVEPDLRSLVTQAWEEGRDIDVNNKLQQFWHKGGDLNTKFFHSIANGWRRRKVLKKPRNSNSAWVNRDVEMGWITNKYICNIFTRGAVGLLGLDEVIPLTVTGDDNDLLLDGFSDADFCIALFHMNPNKASVPDCLNPGFYQSLWGIVGTEVVRY
ncbi:hypothetical protein LINPERHAP1_LOCUS22379 [Linum perenne]